MIQSKKFCPPHTLQLLSTYLKQYRNGSAHHILVLIKYAQKPPIKAHADVSRGARCLEYGPVFIYIHSLCMRSKQGSGFGSDIVNVFIPFVESVSSREWPLLEYADVVWDNCSQYESNELEKNQNEAAH